MCKRCSVLKSGLYLLFDIVRHDEPPRRGDRSLGCASYRWR